MGWPRFRLAQNIRSESEKARVGKRRRILHQTRAITHVVTEFLKFGARSLAAEDVQLVPWSSGWPPKFATRIGRQCVVDGEFTEISGDDALLRRRL